ncbi:MAG: GAF domain-containing protein [Chloroflexota bacterium]
MTGNLFPGKNYHQEVLTRMNRLGAMRNLALLNEKKEPFFDRLAAIAGATIGVPVSLVTMVSANFQFFKSSVGLPEPWNSQRRTPLSHSFCQHVVMTGEPLIIEDAREVDFLKDNLAIPDLNVIAYLGTPLKTPDGDQLGSFCMIDSEPHPWTQDDIAIVTAFGNVVNAEIEARGRAYGNRQLPHYIMQVSRPRMDTLEHDLKNATTTEEIVDVLNRVAEAIRE